MTDTSIDQATATSTAIATVVDAYLDALNEGDAERRAELVRTAWVEDGKFFDPLAEADGHAAIANLTVMAQEHFPGFRFVRTSGIDTHHGIVRFGWAMVDGDDTPAVEGIDVGVLAPDGRLSRIAGFFGPLPERD